MMDRLKGGTDGLKRNRAWRLWLMRKTDVDRRGRMREQEVGEKEVGCRLEVNFCTLPLKVKRLL